MPNSVLRVLLAVVALIAALLMAGVGAGVAGAEPDDPGTVNPSETGTVAAAPAVTEPQPTTAKHPTIFDIPNTIVGQLRNLVGRPLSVFGNGRVPVTHTVPSGTTPDGVMTTVPKRVKPVAKPEPAPPETGLPEPVRETPTKARKPSSAIDVIVPFFPRISVPVPNIPVPGHEATRWTLNLTTPCTAYASVQETVTTVNSLLTDALSPYNPFKPPPPKPEPTFRIFEEEPVVDSSGTGFVAPMSDVSPQLPVVQAAVVIPPLRIPPAGPVAETVPAVTRVLDGAGAVVRAPALNDSAAQTGSTPTGQLPPNGSASPVSNSGAGNPTPREGYSPSLRAARASQIAMVAIPGLAGLIAITASGGVIGYRQANSGRYLRSDAARFLQ